MHNCNEIAPLLSAYIDNEATVTEQALVEQAVASCPACEQRLAELKATSAFLALRLKMPQVEPEGLWDRLTGSLSSTSQATLPSSNRLKRWSISWATVLLLLLSGICYAVYQHNYRPFDPGGVYQPSLALQQVKTDNLQKAVEWAEDKTGYRLSPLSLASRGYYLSTVSVSKVDGLPLACFDYVDKDGERVTIFQASTARPLKGVLGFCMTGPPMISDTRNGRSYRAWQHGNNTYIIVGTIPDTKLRYLAETAASACY